MCIPQSRSGVGSLLDEAAVTRDGEAWRCLSHGLSGLSGIVKPSFLLT